MPKQGSGLVQSGGAPLKKKGLTESAGECNLRLVRKFSNDCRSESGLRSKRVAWYRASGVACESLLWSGVSWGYERPLLVSLATWVSASWLVVPMEWTNVSMRPFVSADVSTIRRWPARSLPGLRRFA